MVKTAFIFPGQGGQFVGQGLAFLDRDHILEDLFDLAEEISGLPLQKISLEGPASLLSRTDVLQPAVLTLSMALAKITLNQGAVPCLAAGHSLGEYGALWLAGVLTERETLTLVSARAKIMQKAAEAKPGAMAAIVKLPAEETVKICELASAMGIIAPANFNTPFQVVVSGEAAAVAAAGRYAKMKGGVSMVLPVSGAFHSPLMAGAAREMEQLLAEADFKKPAFPVVPNVTGEKETDPGRLKELLARQMTAPVCWTKTVSVLEAENLTEIIECWPKLYTGALTAKCLPDKRTAIRPAA
ncbi:MAG: ACP S-malonyltransferase [Deltaproteobacteria bacterium]|jgi:[acyl-carrier-protein] S-malonyltransferase|nr:ACP S-malonyltransferase [Deltaproteobacteria bacterium]